MSNITLMDNSEINQIKKKGEKILEKNPFFTDFIGLMKNSQFKYFYKTYFQNWSDIETMIFYMKLYKFIETEYIDRYDRPISDGSMTYMLDYVIKTQKLRRSAVDSFTKFKNNENEFKKLLDFTLYKEEDKLLIDN
tara:strand:- start:158 stop:565 length:408 start_codon:yes stop_codon:yes gene_type:complete